MRLVTFLKQINEFQQLNTDDQIYLVKLNLIVLSFFHWIFLYDPVTNTYHEQGTTDPSYSSEDWRNTFNEQFHADMQHLRDEFLHLFPSSDVMMKLSFLILIFSNRVSLTQASQHSHYETAFIEHLQRPECLHWSALQVLFTSIWNIVCACCLYTIRWQIDETSTTDRWDQIQYQRPPRHHPTLAIDGNVFCYDRCERNLTHLLLTIRQLSQAVRILQKFEILDFYSSWLRMFRCDSLPIPCISYCVQHLLQKIDSRSL